MRSRAALLAMVSLACAGALAITGALAAEPPKPAKPAPHPPATSHAKPDPKAPKPQRAADTTARRSIAGGSTADDVVLGVESPELRALHEAEKELFPPAMPQLGGSWPSELASPLSAPADKPQVHASGLPPQPSPQPAPSSDQGKDLAWLTHLTMPDLPVRWDAHVVRYLEFFKDDPRGRATFTHLYKRSGRYREMVRRTMRKKGLPEDLVWVAMIESGFDPSARSPAGAVGMWQFTSGSGKIYGLSQDRWVDQRMNPQAATEAAADFFSDLHRRFGSWELALAAYDMGYGGVSSVVRRYNTNDFWALAQTEGSLPWETTLYVPKILAVAVVSKNLGAFGYADLTPDPAIEYDTVQVPPGTPLSFVATAAGCTPKDLESLNPELRASRTPPAEGGDAQSYAVKVPAGKGAAATMVLTKTRKDAPLLERYVVKFGETLDQIAAAHKITVAKLVELNAIAPGEAVRGGTVLLVPKTEAPAPAASPTASKPTVIVPADVFVYPDRKRVFYRVLVGDTLREIAAAFRVTVDDVRRWNNLDPVARLIEGMSLQIYAPSGVDLSQVVVWNESDVHVVAIGSDEFFAYLEQQRGQRRITVVAKAGDTLESIGKHYNVPAKTMERINRKGAHVALKAGDHVVVYVPGGAGLGGNAVASNETHHPVQPNGPAPTPPVPDLLPQAP